MPSQRSTDITPKPKHVTCVIGNPHINVTVAPDVGSGYSLRIGVESVFQRQAYRIAPYSYKKIFEIHVLESLPSITKQKIVYSCLPCDSKISFANKNPRCCVKRTVPIAKKIQTIRLVQADRLG